MEYFEVDVISTKRCRKNYGIVHEELCDDQKHDMYYTGSTNDQEYALGAITWVVGKGDPMDKDRTFSQSFKLSVQRSSAKKNDWPPVRIRIVQFDGHRADAPSSYNPPSSRHRTANNPSITLNTSS